MATNETGSTSMDNVVAEVRGGTYGAKINKGVPLIDLTPMFEGSKEERAALAKEVDAQGVGSLAVRDDSLEGSAASVVLLDAAGQVIDHQPTTIGETS